jgi:hypothetical protein
MTNFQMSVLPLALAIPSALWPRLKVFQSPPPANPITTPKSRIRAINPEIKIDAERFPVLAHTTPRIARHSSKEISHPLDCVEIVPAKPIQKKKNARPLVSREYKKVYAESIAMTEHIIPIGATAAPPMRIPTPVSYPMTRDGLKGSVKRTTPSSKSAIDLK